MVYGILGDDYDVDEDGLHRETPVYPDPTPPGTNPGEGSSSLQDEWGVGISTRRTVRKVIEQRLILGPTRFDP